MMKFKVGDRVRSYGSLGILTGEVTDLLSQGGRISIRTDGWAGFIFSCYPQQCRRLVQKPSIWVPKAGHPNQHIATTVDELNVYRKVKPSGILAKYFTKYVKAKGQS